ncbi:MAG: hypothetical protein LQ347_000823 [Umbilicaria vellea]|nr:MAG: hypothetical protein LQ347_000823 [Umbilicaria vellea]
MRRRVGGIAIIILRPSAVLQFRLGPYMLEELHGPGESQDFRTRTKNKDRDEDEDNDNDNDNENGNENENENENEIENDKTKIKTVQGGEGSEGWRRAVRIVEEGNSELRGAAVSRFVA